MPKLVLNNITSGYASNTLLNSNFSAIATAIEDCVLRSGAAPNSMNADLDLNGHQLLNVSNISLTGGGGSLQGYINDAEAAALESYHWAQHPVDSLVPEGNLATEYSSYHWSIKAGDSAASALSSAASAGASAILAADAASDAALYSSLGLAASGFYDFGSITDLSIIFPTNFGTLV